MHDGSAQAVAEPLDIERIRQASVQRKLDVAIHYRAAVDSTNDEIHSLAPPPVPGMTALFTDFQRGGRGRQGRSWIAPPRSSILVSVRMPWTAKVPLTYCTMVAALSVADAITAVTSAETALKWPNDVLIDGRKVAGILAESDAGGGAAAVVLGIGINCNLPFAGVPELAESATSLSDEVKAPVDRAELGSVLLERLRFWHDVVTSRSPEVFAAWKRKLSTLGSVVVIQEEAETWEGTAVGVKADGGLIVETRHGHCRTVYAGNVSVRTHPRRADHKDR